MSKKSQKWHIKPNGEVDKCNAEKEKCRYNQTPEDHFDTFEEAQQYSDDCNEMWQVFERHNDNLIVSYDGLKNGSYGFQKIDEEELKRCSIKPDKLYILATEKNIKDIEKQYIENMERDTPNLYTKFTTRFGKDFAKSPILLNRVKDLFKYPEEVSFRKHRFYELPKNIESISPNIFENIENNVVNEVCLQLHNGKNYNEQDILTAFNQPTMEDFHKSGNQTIESEKYKCTIKWNGTDWKDGKFRGVAIEFIDKINGNKEQIPLNKNSIFSKYNKYTNPDRYNDYEFEFHYRDIDGEKIIRGSKEEVSQKIREIKNEYESMEFENSIQYYDNIVHIEEKGTKFGEIRNNLGGITKIIKK